MKPPRVLISFPFRIFPTNSGGALRAYYLLRELARHFPTTAVVPENALEIQSAILTELHGNCSLQVRTIPAYHRPKSLAGRLMHRMRTWYRTGDARIPTGAIQFELHRLTMQELQQAHYDVVIATNLESWPLVGAVRRRMPSCHTILDLHNIESELFSRQLHVATNPSSGSALLKHLQRQEARLSGMTDAVFVCSDHDRQQLQARSGPDLPIHVIPNGVDSESARFDRNDQKHLLRDLLFCGTLDYEPNIVGLNWFLREVWPKVLAGDRQLRLVIVGRGFKEQNFPLLRTTEGVRLVGAVDSVSQFYHTCGVSICPLLSGSGTRLKILEAMSYGNPVVSTEIGCEGISARNGGEVLLCNNPADFSAAILRLCGEPELFHAIRAAARRKIENTYDWRVCGQAATNIILEMLYRRLS